MLGRALIVMAGLLLPITAAAASPEGIWEIEMRDSRYRVALCGPDNSQLCGTLIWLGNGADSPQNLPYLNTMLIDHARLVRPNQWRSDLHIYGQSAAGTITEVSEDQITLRGCVFVVMCKTYRFYRYSK